MSKKQAFIIASTLMSCYDLVVKVDKFTFTRKQITRGYP
jgi:hypothetical protein